MTTEYFSRLKTIYSIIQLDGRYFCRMYMMRTIRDMGCGNTCNNQVGVYVGFLEQLEKDEEKEMV